METVFLQDPVAPTANYVAIKESPGVIHGDMIAFKGSCQRFPVSLLADHSSWVGMKAKILLHGTTHTIPVETTTIRHLNL